MKYISGHSGTTQCHCSLHIVQVYIQRNEAQITISSTSSSIMIYDSLVFLFFVSSFFSPSTETSEEPLVDLSDVLNTDADILGMLGKPSNDSGAS